MLLLSIKTHQLPSLREGIKSDLDKEVERWEQLSEEVEKMRE